MSPREHMTKMAGPHRRLARGFTLMELSIVLVIGSGFLMAMTLAQHSRMLQLSAQVMAQRYQGLMAATQRYVALYRSQLSELPVACSVSSYQTGRPKAPEGAVAAGNCALQLSQQGRSVKLANALQPSPDELLSLGLLDAGNPVTLALERQSSVYSPAFAASPASKAPPRLAVLVRKLCDSPACTGAVTLESLVYNVQPYVLEGGNWTFGRMDQVRVLFNELGDGAAMSQDTAQGELVMTASGVSLGNPVLQDGSTQGVLGIVALRGSTNTSLDTQWARRDGQTPISGDWNFGSNKLSGVSSLGAQTVQAQDLQLSGTAALNSASANSIDVDRLQAKNMRMPTATAGQSCDPALANVALDSSNGRLLTCPASTLVWKTP